MFCPTCGQKVFPGATRCDACSTPVGEREKDPLLDRVVGHFRLKSRLGQGGMGAVYLAEHTALGTPYVVKVLHPSLVADPSSRERFRREAVTASLISHENVVFITDYGWEDGLGSYMVMEYLDGMDLGDTLSAEGPLPPDRVLTICEQVAAALEAAHETGVVHRDLKPENVVLVKGRDGRERVKVLDFGIAKVLESGDAGKLTSTGVAIGTPKYMAPEQAAGRVKSIGPWTDVYAFGAIIFELVAGRVPFVSDSAQRLLYMHVQETAPPISKFVPGLEGSSLERLLKRMLAKDHRVRPGTMAEILEVLRDELGAVGAARGLLTGRREVRLKIETDRTAPLTAFQGDDGVGEQDGGLAAADRDDHPDTDASGPTLPVVMEDRSGGAVADEHPTVRGTGPNLSGHVDSGANASVQMTSSLRRFSGGSVAVAAGVMVAVIVTVYTLRSHLGTAPVTRTVHAARDGGGSDRGARPAGRVGPSLAPEAPSVRAVAVPDRSGGAASATSRRLVEKKRVRRSGPSRRKVARRTRKSSTKQDRRSLEVRRRRTTTADVATGPRGRRRRRGRTGAQRRKLLCGLVLRSQPPGAVVYRNGKRMKGRTPLRLVGAKGRIVRLRLAKPGRRSLRFHWRPCAPGRISTMNKILAEDIGI